MLQWEHHGGFKRAEQGRAGSDRTAPATGGWENIRHSPKPNYNCNGRYWRRRKVGRDIVSTRREKLMQSKTFP